jgi:hypothetical protein
MKVLRDSKTKAVLCGDFQLYLPRADMSFSGQQWKNFMELLKGAYRRTRRVCVCVA